MNKRKMRKYIISYTNLYSLRLFFLEINVIVNQLIRRIYIEASLLLLLSLPPAFFKFSNKKCNKIGKFISIAGHAHTYILL